MVALVSEYQVVGGAGLGAIVLGADYLFMAERLQTYICSGSKVASRRFTHHIILMNSLNAHFSLMHFHFSWQLIRLFLNTYFLSLITTQHCYNEHG